MYACVCVFVSVCPALWSIELCDEAVQAVGVQMVYRRPEDSQPVHDSHSASQQLSLPPLTLTLSLSPWWPRKHNTTSVYVCDCRRQQKMQTELSVCMCLFLWLCLCICWYLCECVCVTVAVQGKLLTFFSGLIYHCRTAQKPFVHSSTFIFLTLSPSFYLLPSHPAPREPLHMEERDLELWSLYPDFPPALSFLNEGLGF